MTGNREAPTDIQDERGRPMKRVWILVAIFASFIGSASAQVVTEMTPELIEDARAKAEDADRDEALYPVHERGRFMHGPVAGSFTTPYSRVVLAAIEAKETYRTFAATDVTDQMLAPELVIHGLSQPVGRDEEPIANVRAIVIMPKDSKDRSEAIQPTTSEEWTSEYQNLFGAEFAGQNMTATFPLELLTEDYEVHVVFDEVVSGTQGCCGSCDDCRIKFRLKDVR